jgi:hypothetical protein
LRRESFVSSEELLEREFEQRLLAEGVVREIPFGWNEADFPEFINLSSKLVLK